VCGMIALTRVLVQDFFCMIHEMAHQKRAKRGQASPATLYVGVGFRSVFSSVLRPDQNRNYFARFGLYSHAGPDSDARQSFSQVKQSSCDIKANHEHLAEKPVTYATPRVAMTR
jgi:hypothetical protein